MRMLISLHDFGNMSGLEKTSMVRDLARSAQESSESELMIVEARIRGFEHRYEISSDEMKKRIASGTLAETAEVASWLIALDVKGRLCGKTRT